MTKILFWDGDTQYDFMKRDGKLYVPDAESIIPNLEKLTTYARKKGIPICGCVDAHSIGDEEISTNPDFKDTFPPHCLEGTSGQRKIQETAPLNPLWIDFKPHPRKELESMILRHKGEIIIKKNSFDIFSNPNTDAVLDVLKPEQIVVYGVALDYCDAYSIEGFLRRGGIKVHLVEDATKPINKEKAEKLIQKWKESGVNVLKTSDIVVKGDLEKA